LATALVYIYAEFKQLAQ